jgi:predicted ester cyclase
MLFLVGRKARRFQCQRKKIKPWCADFTKSLTRAISKRSTNCAENYLDHNPPPFPGSRPGLEGLKQAFKLSLVAIPGYHRIEDQIAEGDKVVTRLTFFGKHEGDLPGAPRTGNDLKMTSIYIHRIVNGKLAEQWSEKDVLGFLDQIGLMPSPPRHAD